MRTVGVDLSVSERQTALVAIEWREDRARVGEPSSGLGDEALLDLLVEAEWVGIDAPFGWPEAMVDALHSYATTGRWPAPAKPEFRYRLTDRFAHDRVLAETEQKLWPLSPSTDRIALTAWRLAGLREAAWERSGIRFDRSGGDRVVEAYPAAALLLWGLERSGYKADPEAREELLAAIEAQAPWLAWEPGAWEACVASDDALDAVLCALLARAAALGLTAPPPAADLELARAEGWIHLPRKEACLLAAYRTYGAQLGADLAAAWSGPQRWAEKVAAAIAALLGFGAEQPDQLRFLLLDASSVAPALLAAQREALELLSARLREGRAAGERAADLVPDTEEMIVAALAQRVGRCLLDGDRLADLQGELVEFALTPYMGWEGAREVATSTSSSPATLDVSSQPPRVEGHSPASLDDRQRRRAFDSLPALLAEYSYGELTVNHILQRIGMSSRTFYALFESKDDCLLATYRFLADRLEVELGDAWQAEPSWPAKVRGAIAATLAFAAKDPAVARLLAVDVQAAGRAARGAQAESIDRLAAELREGRRLYPAAAGLNRSTETVIVAGLVALIGSRLLAGKAERLPDCESELAELALAPFVGTEWAPGLAQP